jgi:hypothetical protein
MTCKKVIIILFTFVNSLCIDAQDLPLGKPWYDTDGKSINAHGAGILVYNNTYYWFGEFKGAGKTGHQALEGVSCYTSKDLIHWKNEGIALKVINDTTNMLQPGCLIERPKVIYNKKNKQFVMWFHHELKDMGYKAAMTGLAVANQPQGPYTYIKSIRPNKQQWPVNFPVEQQIPIDTPVVRGKDTTWRSKVEAGLLVRRDFKSGQMSRDMTLYVDNDGIAYHIASAEDNQTLHISKLNDAYTDFTGEYYRVLPGQANEAPAIFKYKKKYYMFASGTTGWQPNPGRSFVAAKVTGPWQALGNPVGGTKDEAATTFKSQSTYILPIGKKKNKFIYMGDRWIGDNLIESSYIWLPIIFENKKPVIYWKDDWAGK